MNDSTNHDSDDKNNKTMDDNDDGVVIIKQKLMSVDEVYVYKIPPLKDAGGHRAEDWNLASPLQTCSLLVERQSDMLVIEFISTETKHLFAVSYINLLINPNIQYYMEQVVDSSRYYTIRIMEHPTSEKTAVIGFGFRERDESIDFKEAIQYYTNSIKRQQQAEHIAAEMNQHTNATDNDDSNSAAATTLLKHYSSIPKLAEGEKIHINVKHSNSDNKDVPKRKKGSGGGGGVPLLLKKPPPPS